MQALNGQADNLSHFRLILADSSGQSAWVALELGHGLTVIKNKSHQPVSPVDQAVTHCNVTSELVAECGGHFPVNCSVR